MTKVPNGFVAIPLLDPETDPKRNGPVFGKVAGMETMTVTFWLKNARSIREATSEVPYTLSAAASVFGMLHKMTAAGFAPEEGELCGLYELCQRGLEAAAEKEGGELSDLDELLRWSLSKYPKKEEEE
jgi:hypothetical protein